MNTHWAVWNFGMSAPWLLTLLGAVVVLLVRGGGRWPRVVAVAGLSLLFLTAVVDAGLHNVCNELGWDQLREYLFGTDRWTEARRFTYAAGLGGLIAAAFVGRTREQPADDG